MKILVLTTSYPEGDNVEAYFVHTRNIYYMEKDIDVTVLNFKATETYYKDGIKVITEKDFDRNEKYDLFVCHAANIRQHLKFIKKNLDVIPKLVFFFHGHEVMIQSQVYPKPYPFVKDDNFAKKMVIEAYDRYKLNVWKNFFIKNRDKVEFVFVSKWMQNMFERFVGITEKDFPGKFNIIYNSVGKKFEESTWDINTPKKYDVLTVRSNIDGSKYCVDLINQLAFNNPDVNFVLYGKGKYFEHNKKAPNIKFINRNLSHDEIVEEINKAKVALLPTRTDAQGVMACEFNITGIPLITSDIEVCREVFDGIKNVELISNDHLNKMTNLTEIINELHQNYKNKIPNKFISLNTIEKEVSMFKNIIKGR